MPCLNKKRQNNLRSKLSVFLQENRESLFGGGKNLIINFKISDFDKCAKHESTHLQIRGGWSGVLKCPLY